MGQYFTEVYRALPDTEVVAIAEWNDTRREIVGKRFGVKALFKDVNSMLREVVPDIAAVITPTKFMKEAVIACAEAGVKGVSTDKPIAARLSDADAMVDACEKRNVVFAGGNLQRAMWEVQHAGGRLRNGDYGPVKGAVVHRFWRRDLRRRLSTPLRSSPLHRSGSRGSHGLGTTRPSPRSRNRRRP